MAIRCFVPNSDFFQVNPLQLFSMAEWPWDVHSLLFDVEQVETVKIFLRFGTEWWNDILPGTGRSITTLPLRQVWAYAPKVLMVYGDSNNARFWKPYLVPHAKPTPTWIKYGFAPQPQPRVLLRPARKRKRARPPARVSTCVYGGRFWYRIVLPSC